jgi:hypothetical protein
MKINIASRRRAAWQTRYKTTFEPNYSHDAWSTAGEVGPIPATTPDAFDAIITAVMGDGSRQRTGSSRNQPHEALSIGKLTRRLQAAGVRGSKARSLAREIHAGPQFGATVALGGTFVLNWPVAELERRFGHRVTRAISRFVRKKLVLMDEAWALLSEDRLSNYMTSQFRKFDSRAVTVVQDVAQLETAVR